MEKPEEYAVVRDGSKQYKVAKGDVIDIDLREAEAGQAITFDKVMLFRCKEDIRIGQPSVEGVSVTAEVEGAIAGDKLVAFKYKRRKGYHKKTGHRQKYTRVKITDFIIK